MRDSSTQLKTGLQAFLQQSVENMFNRLAPAQTNPAPQTTTLQPHIVSITPLSWLPQNQRNPWMPLHLNLHWLLKRA